MTAAHTPTPREDDTKHTARLAVFLSGSGRTLINIADSIEKDELNAEIGLVVASRECPGYDRARRRNLPARIEKGTITERRLIQILDASRIDWVVLAGYLQLLPVPARYFGKVVNIHPSLLPKYGGPGMFGDRVHQAVLNARDSESGCTVHLCDGEYDSGRIILQRRCAVQENDSPETLAARVFALETEAYPDALRTLIAGNV